MKQETPVEDVYCDVIAEGERTYAVIVWRGKEPKDTEKKVLARHESSGNRLEAFDRCRDDLRTWIRELRRTGARRERALRNAGL